MSGLRIRTRAGFSLVELVVLVGLISIAAPPLLVLFCQTVQNSAEAVLETKALELAKGLTEELLSKQFEDPQLAKGSFGREETNRIDFDDVDDYDGYDQSPPTDCRNAALAAYAGFRTRVTVENVSADSPGAAAVADGSSDYKRVTVTVLWRNNTRSVPLVSMMSSQDRDAARPLVYLTYLSRQASSTDDLVFRVRNDSSNGIYLTNVIATWSAPTAYYESIAVNAIGYLNYGTVWSYSQCNRVRMESGGNAMFNQGAVVYIPVGATMEISLINFRNSATSLSPSNRDVSGTQFSIVIWAGPDHCSPFAVPSF